VYDSPVKRFGGGARAELKLENVTVDFQGIRAIEDVSLQMLDREILGLIGPNGAGKTTLVNVLTGFQKPSAGRVTGVGKSLSGWPPWRRARAGMARTFQGAMLFPKLTVVENVEAGALAMGVKRRQARAHATQVLQWLGLADIAEKAADGLPFGAERKVGIGRALATNPRFLLMDEPAAGLNDAECLELAELIRRIRNDIGCGILLIEHRMSLVFSVSDRIQVLDQGRTIAMGVPDAVKRDQRVREAYLGGVE
jgi:branched-chain amino acid transport system ATP-binding protein